MSETQTPTEAEQGSEQDEATTPEHGDAAGGSDHLEQEGDIAADYLEELLEIVDLDGDIDMDVEGDRATVSIVGADLPQLEGRVPGRGLVGRRDEEQPDHLGPDVADLPQLVGRDGEVLEALQELTRLAVYRETGERSRLMLDVSGHRAGRRAELEQVAAEVVGRVRASGEQESLGAMSPFERKVVHDAVAAAGLTSESEGVEPKRFVVVLPAESGSDTE